MRLSRVTALAIATSMAVGLTVTTTVTVASAAPAPHIVGAYPDTMGFNNAGGYVLYSNGRVNAIDGAPFYGDARTSGLDDFTTMAEDLQGGKGYWLVTATGKVFTYGGTCEGDTISAPKDVIGPIVGTLQLSLAQQNNGNVDTGFQMVNAKGTVYPYLCELGF